MASKRYSVFSVNDNPEPVDGQKRWEVSHQQEFMRGGAMAQYCRDTGGVMLEGRTEDHRRNINLCQGDNHFTRSFHDKFYIVSMGMNTKVQGRLPLLQCIVFHSLLVVDEFVAFKSVPGITPLE